MPAAMMTPINSATVRVVAGRTMETLLARAKGHDRSLGL